jgi:hypothetical protein
MEGHVYLERMSGDWTEAEMEAFAKLLSLSPSPGRRTALPTAHGVTPDMLEGLSAVTLSLRSATGPDRVCTALLEWGIEDGTLWISVPMASHVAFMQLGAEPAFFLKTRFRGGKAGHAVKLYTLMLSVRQHGDFRLSPEDAAAIFGRAANAADFRRFVLDPAMLEIKRSGVGVPARVEARRDMRRKGAPLRHWLVTALGAAVSRCPTGEALDETETLALSREGILNISRLAGVSPAEVPELWQLAIASAREAAAGGSIDDAAMLRMAEIDPDKAAMDFFREL